MRKQYYKCIAFCICVLFVFMTTGGAGLTWREMWQEDLDRTLIAAIKRVDAKTTSDLLNRGADANARDTPERTRGIHPKSRQGTPALLVAIEQPHEMPEMSREYNQRCVSIVKALLDHGANVHAKDSKGYDAVYNGVRCDSDTGMLSLLIRYHAPVNGHSPDDGWTPLMWAARNGVPDDIEMLIAAGARINDRDNEGDTALGIAVDMARGDNVEVLLAHHADVFCKNKAGSTPLTMAQADLAAGTQTPFLHEEVHETWSDIVRQLKAAAKREGKPK